MSSSSHPNQINRGLSSDKGLPEPLAPTDQTVPMTPEQQAEYLRNVVDPATGLRVDGPTLEEYVDAGYPATQYPPHSYAAKDSPGWQEEQARRVADQANAQGDSQPLPVPQDSDQQFLGVRLEDAGSSDLAPGGGTQTPAAMTAGETADIDRQFGVDLGAQPTPAAIDPADAETQELPLIADPVEPIATNGDEA